MAYGEYQKYGKTQLAKIFNIDIQLAQLFAQETPLANAQEYAKFQQRMDNLAARTRIAHTNEATRIGLLVSPVLVEASIMYDLGLFFEQTVDLSAEETPELPHSLNGAWDGTLTLDSLDFSVPIISVVEVKPNRVSDGLGQCLAELYATRKKFAQEEVYGIITDGEAWAFLLLSGQQLLIHKSNCHISNVVEILGNIGEIVAKFRGG